MLFDQTFLFFQIQKKKNNNWIVCCYLYDGDLRLYALRYVILYWQPVIYVYFVFVTIHTIHAVQNILLVAGNCGVVVVYMRCALELALPRQPS